MLYMYYSICLPIPGIYTTCANYIYKSIAQPRKDHITSDIPDTVLAALEKLSRATSFLGRNVLGTGKSGTHSLP